MHIWVARSPRKGFRLSPKVAVVHGWPRRKDSSELRRFLVLASWLRDRRCAMMPARVRSGRGGGGRGLQAGCSQVTMRCGCCGGPLVHMHPPPSPTSVRSTSSCSSCASCPSHVCPDMDKRDCFLLFLCIRLCFRLSPFGFFFKCRSSYQLLDYSTTLFLFCFDSYCCYSYYYVLFSFASWCALIYILDISPDPVRIPGSCRILPLLLPPSSCLSRKLLPPSYAS